MRGGLKLASKTIEVPDNVDMVVVLGQYDNRLRFLRKRFSVNIDISDKKIVVAGSDESVVETVENILSQVVTAAKKGYAMDWNEFESLVDFYSSWDRTSPQNTQESVLSGRIRPKTRGQAEYVDAMRKFDVVFSIGPAGTGKTYLAVAMALDYLKSGIVQRIILTRPAVEAGERLGFLPGDLVEKVDPYLRPIYDAIMDMMPAEKFYTYRQKGIIEIAPLAFMRGRTLNNCFVILDEAQNATHQQMKMFLTRIGFNSKAVITGDVTQIDIDKGNSGLIECESILKGIDGIAFVYLSESDVVRHPVVKEIIKAYENYERNRHEKDS
ncbi:MAG TPA: PhoH family protein [Pseudothermotoga sp.]|nr:PhoH family protein [Pseudothermotoga sp.]HOK83318.1 PhoH family protein [Pseudothermotoga sp.]HPP70143.1 PhoH family protein [Pseudothermotoga sp.]